MSEVGDLGVGLAEEPVEVEGRLVFLTHEANGSFLEFLQPH